MIPVHSFTLKASGLARVLVTEVKVGLPFELGKKYVNSNDPKTYRGIWDTGATQSMITERVVRDCGLSPVGMINVNTAGGAGRAPTFLVSLWLPNRVCLPSVLVSQGDLMEEFQLLIGMDVIGMGDFVINNKDGKTSFSFRIPSLERVDYVDENNYEHISDGVGLNDPCWCLSGEKYKRCHGREGQMPARKRKRGK